MSSNAKYAGFSRKDECVHFLINTSMCFEGNGDGRSSLEGKVSMPLLSIISLKTSHMYVNSGYLLWHHPESTCGHLPQPPSVPGCDDPVNTK